MHKPVLLKEIIEYLDPKPGDCFIDATLNGGGHSEEILKKIGPDGKVLGIEIDPELIAAAMLKIENEKIKNLILVNDSYVNIKNIQQGRIRKDFQRMRRGAIFKTNSREYRVIQKRQTHGYNQRFG